MRGVADYEFERPLWHGNSGTFWLARTPTRLGIDDEHVAVKVLEQGAGDDDFRRMANELRLFAHVRSEFLVTLYDAGHDGGRLYYSSRYHPRGSTDVAAVEPAVRLAAVADAARGAHALHEVGVAHRDIKPSNVLVADRGGVLADLGLAQVLNPGQTVTGFGPVGAIEFVAPEIVAGQVASRASDVWALAATLHRVATGRSLYPGLPTGSLLDALRHVTSTRPAVDADCPDDVADLVTRCLQVDPADRPATAEDVARSIDPIAERAT